MHVVCFRYAHGSDLLLVSMRVLYLYCLVVVFGGLCENWWYVPV